LVEVCALDLIAHAARDESHLVLELLFVIDADGAFDLSAGEQGECGKADQDDCQRDQEHPRSNAHILHTVTNCGFALLDSTP